ncbi:hypothetical protein [Candidatus Bandiella euplotis]|uniref:Uncharacterized protein n=1 Tax=Candidatus Bandiella euplotis TaxID=1664265 RepID=A0ABZ0UJR8_9RICK|nr:hypothetical protein [Candidatus Bandiella woodruffii]WPX96354.1 hypothetical protein Bandiella_00463 [Candidatus Bandiella woodruffii]
MRQNPSTYNRKKYNRRPEEFIFFDVADSDGVIRFIPRENKSVHKINCEDVVLLDNGKSSMYLQTVSKSQMI